MIDKFWNFHTVYQLFVYNWNHSLFDMEWVYYLLKQKLAVGKNLIIQTRLNNESSGSASLAPYLSALLTSDWACNSINSRLTHSILFYTVCKFGNFSATQILREIKVGKSGASKRLWNRIFMIFCNFWVLKFAKEKIESLLMQL